MGIQFLQVTPETAIEELWEAIRKGYATRHSMQGEYDKANGIVTDSMVTEWINRINNWATETKDKLMNIYATPNYMYKFLEIVPNVISNGEEGRFYNLKAGVLQRVAKLESFADFLITHSDPTFSTQNNITYIHLNPERDVNLAGRDVNTKN